jgi:hypothetical protein
VFFIATLVGCGGGSGASNVEIEGVWNVTLALGANSCPNDAKVLPTLEDVHTVVENVDQSGSGIVTLIDAQGQESITTDSPPREDSFIVTGVPQPLNPFVTGAECVETIVWSYFDISSDTTGVFTDNIGRNSIISCASPSGQVDCSVFYTGRGRKE